MEPDRKKVLLVDDEPKIVEVAKSYLESNGYAVYAADSGKSALQLFQQVNPTLIILDLMLPDMSGEEICRILRDKSKVPIIILSAKVEEDNILNGLSIGADDYITKPFSPRQLVARVAALIRRTEDEKALPSKIWSYNCGDLTIDFDKYEVKKRNMTVCLTPYEYKILTTLIKYPNKVFTRDELIVIALGDQYEGFNRTIDSHIKNLRQKIETDSKDPKYIVTVHGVGYKFGS